MSLTTNLEGYSSYTYAITIPCIRILGPLLSRTKRGGLASRETLGLQKRMEVIIGYDLFSVLMRYDVRGLWLSS